MCMSLFQAHTDIPSPRPGDLPPTPLFPLRPMHDPFSFVESFHLDARSPRKGRGSVEVSLPPSLPPSSPPAPLPSAMVASGVMSREGHHHHFHAAPSTPMDGVFHRHPMRLRPSGSRGEARFPFLTLLFLVVVNLAEGGGCYSI
jgi:hypothetical protein